MLEHNRGAELAETTPFIKVRDVHFSRGSKLIFDGVDMDFQRGKVTAIMGPSGTGKTTLLADWWSIKAIVWLYRS